MGYEGHQVFVCHPDPAVRDRLVDALRDREYEAFAVDDPLEVIGSRHRESILFLGSAESGDRDLFGRLDSEDPELKVILLGSSAHAAGERETIDADGSGLAVRIVTYLEGIGARGHRHFVRFGSQYATIATFDFEHERRRYAGVIHDISIAGISCTFKPEPDRMEHIHVPAMHLSLPVLRTSVSGHFTTGRVISGQTIHVFVFDPMPSAEVVEILHDFIFKSLRTKLSLH